MAIDNDKLQEFLGKFVGDLGATVAAGNVVVGHNLGLYQALATGPATAQELASRTETDPLNPRRFSAANSSANPKPPRSPPAAPVRPDRLASNAETRGLADSSGHLSPLPQDHPAICCAQLPGTVCCRGTCAAGVPVLECPVGRLG